MPSIFTRYSAQIGHPGNTSSKNCLVTALRVQEEVRWLLKASLSTKVIYYEVYKVSNTSYWYSHIIGLSGSGKSMYLKSRC